MTDSPLDTALLTLSRFVVADIDLQNTLVRVAGLTKEAIPAAFCVGFSLLDHDGNPSTPVYTDPLAPTIDQAQYDDDRGPCLEAGRTGQIVRIEDLSTARDRYPAFVAAAEAHGISSTLSLPLLVTGSGIGAINLYGEHVATFSDRDESTGIALAEAISVVLANVTAYWNARSMSEHLNEAMKSRAVIEQAKGILMAQRRGTTPDEAFDMLRGASQRENVKLRDIAQRVVDRSVGTETSSLDDSAPQN